ncbi:hypothetical protein C0Q70_14404 [Pomacea canaliculata]|uniref:Uncharacterized protein n=1 Tax=Pomacea canaliculata TaxID=400727 RepID=A0A2T7NZZ5_POMCA|nr:hypothetical protein C0Q70_14404 [Pomacea canaliculata]
MINSRYGGEGREVCLVEAECEVRQKIREVGGGDEGSSTHTHWPEILWEEGRGGSREVSRKVSPVLVTPRSQPLLLVRSQADRCTATMAIVNNGRAQE